MYYNKDMKLLYVITQGEQGGGQKYVLDLATEMQRKGNEVFVAVGEMPEVKDKWLFENLKRVGVKEGNLFEVKSHQREIKIWRDTKSVFEFVKLYRKVQPDIVHLNSSKAGFVGAIAGFLTGIKTVYTVHGFVFLEPMNFIKKFIYIFLEFTSARLRNFTILITQKDIDVGERFVVLWGKKNYELIYNGVKDLREKMLRRDEGRKYIFDKINKKDDGQKIVGTIANLFKTKGLEYFIDAAVIVVNGSSKGAGDFLFVVLGFGPEEYRNELQDRINKLGLQNNFFLLGKTPDAFKYLKGLDLFALSSVKEGLPYCLLEASMANIPIVATSVGGIPEMAQHIKINLVDSQNSAKLAGKILDEVQIVVDEVQNGEVLTPFPEIFKLENMINKTLEVYQKMLK